MKTLFLWDYSYIEAPRTVVCGKSSHTMVCGESPRQGRCLIFEVRSLIPLKTGHIAQAVRPLA